MFIGVSEPLSVLLDETYMLYYSQDYGFAIHRIDMNYLLGIEYIFIDCRSSYKEARWRKRRMKSHAEPAGSLFAGGRRNVLIATASRHCGKTSAS